MTTIDTIAWSSDLHQLARRFGDRVAVNSGIATLTYTDLDRRAHGLARLLLDQGIAPGTPIGTYLRNGTDAVWASYGVTMSGAGETPLNPAFTPAELEWCVQLTRIEKVVTDRTHAKDLRRLGIETILVEDVAPAAAGVTFDPVPADAWGRITFSSGTTGKPKGLVYSHGRRWLAHVMLKTVLPFHPLPGSRTLLMTPFVHGAALQTFAWLDHGGEVLLLDGIDVPRVEAFLASGTVDGVFAPPTVIAKLAAEFAGRTFANVRTVFTGTATLTPGLYAKARAMFGPVVRITYGKGENTNPITILEAADTEAYFRGEADVEGACLGWPAPSVELAILDESGARVPDGEVGEIWIRSRHEYIGHIDAQGFNPLSPEGGHRTGDSGRIDDRGRLWLMGRLADVMKSGGYKIYPQEIEAVLSGVPGCTQICVASLPSDYWGEVIIAVAEGVSNPAWIEAARERVGALARYKHPRAYLALEPLPRNPQGKLNRRDVRAAILDRYTLADGPRPEIVPRG